MQVYQLVRLQIAIFIILAAASLIFSLMVNRVNNTLYEAFEQRRELLGSVQELHTVSADLTRWVRAYTVSGDRQHYIDFQHELNVADRRGIILATLYYHNATEDEIALALHSIDLAMTGLGALEFAAFEAVHRGDFYAAQNYVFSEEYDARRQLVLDALSTLYDTVDERTYDELYNAINMVSRYEFLSNGLLVIFVFVGVGGTSFLAKELARAKRREEEARASNAIAEEESRAKTRFLARMSHEIRTPMNAVMGITDMYLQRKLPQDMEDAFLRIHSSSRLLMAIINDILDLSRFEAGKMEILAEPYETSSFIVDTVQLNMIHVGSKLIEFKLFVGEDVPARLIGDERRLKQILNNLLSNAFKYTQEGSVALSLHVEQAAQAPGDETMLVIRVTDTGRGMNREEVDQIFAGDFTRFNEQSNRVIEGSGLGMNITYLLIQSMGGKIIVHSEPGSGTSFIVRIPQRIEGDRVLGADAVSTLTDVDTIQRSLKKVALVTYEPMPYGRILVVDDVEVNLFVIRGLLQNYQIQVETAMSGAEALKKIEQDASYDIIFMDHMMPDMDGIEATRRIRARHYTAPIIALTANTVAGTEDLFLSSGFDAVLGKPVDLHRLDSTLKRYVRDINPANRAVAKQLQSYFAQDARRAITGMQHYDQLGDYILHAHAMKHALLQLGNAALSEDARALEEAARAQNLELIAANNGAFIEALRALVE